MQNQGIIQKPKNRSSKPQFKMNFDHTLIGRFRRISKTSLTAFTLAVGIACSSSVLAQEEAPEPIPPIEEFDSGFWEELSDLLKLLQFNEEQRAAIQVIFEENQEARIQSRQALANVLIELEKWDGAIETEDALREQLTLAITDSSILLRDTWDAIWEIMTLQQRITVTGVQVLVRAQMEDIWDAYEPLTPEERRVRRQTARETYLARVEEVREALQADYPDLATVLDILRGQVESSPFVQSFRDRVEEVRLTEEQKDAFNLIFTDYQPLVLQVREELLFNLLDLYDAILGSENDESLSTMAESLTGSLIDQKLVQLEILDEIFMILTDEQLTLILTWREWLDTKKDSLPLERGWRIGALGLYNDSLAPWVYHAHLGWLYVNTLNQVEDQSDRIWIYQPRSDSWFFSQESIFPYVYRPSDRVWLYIEENWLYNFETETWEPAG